MRSAASAIVDDCWDNEDSTPAESRAISSATNVLIAAIIPAVTTVSRVPVAASTISTPRPVEASATESTILPFSVRIDGLLWREENVAHTDTRTLSPVGKRHRCVQN